MDVDFFQITNEQLKQTGILGLDYVCSYAFQLLTFHNIYDG